jgi:hypothetical protein
MDRECDVIDPGYHHVTPIDQPKTAVPGLESLFSTTHMPNRVNHQVSMVLRNSSMARLTSTGFSA